MSSVRVLGSIILIVALLLLNGCKSDISEGSNESNQLSTMNREILTLENVEMKKKEKALEDYTQIGEVFVQKVSQHNSSIWEAKKTLNALKRECEASILTPSERVAIENVDKTTTQMIGNGESMLGQEDKVRALLIDFNRKFENQTNQQIIITLDDGGFDLINQTIRIKETISTIEQSLSFESNLRGLLLNTTIACQGIKKSRGKIGQKISIDYLSYTVLEVESFTKMGTAMFSKLTNGKFIKVNVEILNNAKETKEIFSPRFRLIDGLGREYDRLNDDYLYITDTISFGNQLQPGLPIKGSVVFEVPKDSSDLMLTIKGDALSLSQVVVVLNEIQDIGVENSLKEHQDKIMDQAMEDGRRVTEKIMGQCNPPFECSSSCSEYGSVGQKDCSSSEVCCLGI
ncbi:DUF4352 domain-containing protein [Candidatus Woesearchaeota archaeon]|nr:DUF4352 domain-containing protein [Candidatus Woesearchaeota archaeon]